MASEKQQVRQNICWVIDQFVCVLIKYGDTIGAGDETANLLPLELRKAAMNCLGQSLSGGGSSNRNLSNNSGRRLNPLQFPSLSGNVWYGSVQHNPWGVERKIHGDENIGFRNILILSVAILPPEDPKSGFVSIVKIGYGFEDLVSCDIGICNNEPNGHIGRRLDTVFRHTGDSFQTQVRRHPDDADLDWIKQELGIGLDKIPY